MNNRRALLRLRDGTCFYGLAYGSSDSTVGEVVFNTAMTGYQEIITDPSYAQQIITFTYPHIGNTGINDEDYESDGLHASGVVIRSPARVHSNYRSRQSLSDWMQQKNLTGISRIDTRALTHHIRNHGAQDGAIVSYFSGKHEDALAQAEQLLVGFSGLQGTDLAQEVSTRTKNDWRQGSWSLENGFSTQSSADRHVVVYDFGVKRNILRLLVDQGCRITVVPAITPANVVLALQPDGVLLSNGPGDPQPCTYAITAIQQLLAKSIPIFGICLGFQLLALALGGTTGKMKFGHHGANHPVEDNVHHRVNITSQNHGFEVIAASIADKVVITHKSLFDGSLQGFRTLNTKAMGFQGHPEANPGPQDIEPLFQEFTGMMDNAKT